MEETTFYVNHKPKKRLIWDLGLGYTDRKVGDIPELTTVWIQYFEDEGRKPFFVYKARNTGQRVEDRRGYAFINSMNMSTSDYLNNRSKLKKALKKAKHL